MAAAWFAEFRRPLEQKLLADRAIRYDGRMAISHPTDPRIRGLAAAVLTSDIPPWEFDIKAVEPGSDVVEISDWERRLRRKQIERGSTVDAGSIRGLDVKDGR